MSSLPAQLHCSFLFTCTLQEQTVQKPCLRAHQHHLHIRMPRRKSENLHQDYDLQLGTMSGSLMIVPLLRRVNEKKQLFLCLVKKLEYLEK